MDNYKATIILLFSFLLFHHSLAVVNTISSENRQKNVEQKQVNFEKEGEKIKSKRDENQSSIQNDIAEDRISHNDLSSVLQPQYPSSQYTPDVPQTFLPPANSFIKNFRSPDLMYVNPKLPFSRPPFPRGYPSFLPWKMNIPFNNLPPMKTFKTSPFPTSVEAYGPPRKPALPPFLAPGFPSKDFKRLSAPRIIPNNLHQDFSKLSIPGVPGVPGLQRIRNAFAPPTPPDIEYDGWQPIAGSISGPNHQNLQPDTLDSQLSSQTPDHTQITGIPSNSYGEPINNLADHNLKQQVIKTETDSGLPPPVLPDAEPLHNIQEQTNLNPLQFLSHPVEPVINNHNVNNDFPPSVGGDLEFQQLPKVNNEEALKLSFDNFKENVDSYLVPPPSSFSATGPYPASRRPDYNKRHQHAYHIPRNTGPIRPHTSLPFCSLPGNLIPPRNWANKFRDSTGEFSSLTNMYSLPVHHFTQFEKPQEAPITDSDVSMSFNQLIVNDDVLSALHTDLDQNSTALIKNTEINEDHYDNSLASSITNEIPSDDLQIQGPKGTYRLQIQPADGLKSADDSVVHSQLLSDGLLQNIIAAIEQPGEGPIEIQNTPQAQSLQQIHTHTHQDFIDLSAASSSIFSVMDKQLLQVDTSKSIETEQMPTSSS
ncbi:uncharacterized protein [Chelonus insularis]|uniref:uncharacterized protein n=1 Tax=Chelonus insularis TaxID=460826 RepID=UPI00158B31A8|nr:uncharacterized protein LOC118065751 [Chelonus insularis]